MVDISTFEPYLGFKFQVLIGADRIGFQQVDGLHSVSAVVPYREGDMPIWVRKFPGLIEWQPVTLQKGSSNSTMLIDWRSEVAAYTQPGGEARGTGKGDGSLPDLYRREVVIELLAKGNDSTPARRWTLKSAWPSELRLAPMNAMGNEPLIETLVLQHEGMLIETLGGGGHPGETF